MDDDKFSDDFSETLLAPLKELQHKLRVKRRLFEDRIEDLAPNCVRRAEIELSQMFKTNVMDKSYHYVGDITSKVLFMILDKFSKYGYVYITKPFSTNVFDDSLYIITLPYRLIPQNFNIASYIDFVYSVYAMNSYFLKLIEQSDYSTLSNYRLLIDNIEANKMK